MKHAGSYDRVISPSDCCYFGCCGGSSPKSFCWLSAVSGATERE